MYSTEGIHHGAFNEYLTNDLFAFLCIFDSKMPRDATPDEIC